MNLTFYCRRETHSLWNIDGGNASVRAAIGRRLLSRGWDGGARRARNTWDALIDSSSALSPSVTHPFKRRYCLEWHHSNNPCVYVGQQSESQVFQKTIRKSLDPQFGIGRWYETKHRPSSPTDAAEKNKLNRFQKWFTTDNDLLFGCRKAARASACPEQGDRLGSFGEACCGPPAWEYFFTVWHGCGV